MPEGYGGSVYRTGGYVQSRPRNQLLLDGRVGRVNGIIFDMDGVVVLSSAIHARAFSETLQPFGVTFDYGCYAGMTTRDALAAIALENGLNLSSDCLDALARSKREAALRSLRSSVPLAPSAREVLVALHHDFPLALATSASEASVRTVIEGSGFGTYFRCILSSADCRTGKPAPDIYVLAAARLGVDPRECLVVEDSVAGIAAARSAGAKCAAVSGTLTPAELARCGADVVLGSLSELIA